MNEQTAKPAEYDDFEIEIVDDTPADDKGRPRRPEGAAPEIPEDDDLEQYSDGVKKRISKLKYEFHEERRRADESTRLRDEAVSYAQRQQEEIAGYRKRLSDGDAAFVSQAQGRVKSQLEQVKAKMKAAYEAGDSDAFVSASAELADVKGEEGRLASYRPPQPQQAAPQRPSVPKPSPRAESWATTNDWFGKDAEMTALAFGIHERAVREGIAPDSEAYYTEIDTAMRQRFPDKFATSGESTPRKKPGSVVAPGGRSTSATPRKVTLTATQVSLAKKLGLTVEQYAAQIIKEMKNG
jgi:hypothetical protein